MKQNKENTEQNKGARQEGDRNNEAQCGNQGSPQPGAIDSSSKYCLDGAKLKNICKTVQVLPECLRLSTVPAVHYNIAL